MLGIKKHKATSMLGVKQPVPMKILGQKTYGPHLNVGNQPHGDYKNGIVNESHGTMMDREPMKNNYKPPKQNVAGIEKR